ncbi:MAG: Stp1/IreP family PP2C-type Ser/Thr phosphatase [bacterium]
MKVLAYGASDLGMKRQINEDSFRICPKSRVYMVADGMGGHAAGDIASSMAVNLVAEYLHGHMNAAKQNEKSHFLDILAGALDHANRQIIFETHQKQALRGMGTTLVVVIYHGGRLFVANVGDSRVYLIRNNKIGLLTTDHSWVNMQMQLGNMTTEESRLHPMRNVITRALGTQNDVEADILEYPIQQNDYLILCTDGLTNMLGDKEIAETVLQCNNDVKTAVEELVRKANASGGDDNITVIVLKFLPEHNSNEFYSQDTEVMLIRPLSPGKRPCYGNTP